MKILSKEFLKQKKLGFSMIELSVVLVVMGIMTVGMISLGTATLESAKIAETKSIIAKIQKAMIVYYKKNNSLPCPADGTLALTDNNFAFEQKTNSSSDTTISNATCSASYSNLISTVMYYGTVPTRTLKLPDYYAFDAWGNRITYNISKDCVDPDNWNSSHANICRKLASPSLPGGSITITDINLNPILDDAAYFLVSHGKNGVGAWRRAGGSTRIPSTASTSARETSNAHVNTSGVTSGYDILFRSDFINDGDVTANYFDDITFWQTAEQVNFDANN